jgi:hypothetical protein
MALVAVVAAADDHSPNLVSGATQHEYCGGWDYYSMIGTVGIPRQRWSRTGAEFGGAGDASSVAEVHNPQPEHAQTEGWRRKG